MRNVTHVFGFEISAESKDQKGKLITLTSLAALKEKVSEKSAQDVKDAALKLACFANHPDAVDYLLQIGANPNATPNTTLDILNYFQKRLSLFNDYVITPVRIAISYASERVLNSLLGADAKSEIQTTKKVFRIKKDSELHQFLVAPDSQQFLEERYKRDLEFRDGDIFVDPFILTVLLGFFKYKRRAETSEEIDEVFALRDELQELGDTTEETIIKDTTHLIFYCEDELQAASVIRHDKAQSWRTARRFDLSILHDCIQFNKFPVFKFLVADADLTCTDSEGCTPLMCAVRRSETQYADALLAANADCSLDLVDKEGKNIFDHACGGMTWLIKDLIEKNPGKISHKQLQKKLEIVAIWHNVELMDFLCEQGASIEQLISEHKGELRSAIIQLGVGADLAVVKAYVEYLISCGASPETLDAEYQERLQKVLAGKNPYIRELSQEEIAARNLLTTRLLQFMRVSFTWEELAEQKKHKTITDHNDTLGGLIHWMVSYKKCQPPIDLVEQANNLGLYLQVLRYETRLEGDNVPVFGLLHKGKLLSEHHLSCHEADSLGLSETHIHGDDELWGNVKAQIAKLTGKSVPLTTVDQPGSSHMFVLLKGTRSADSGCTHKNTM